MSELMLAWQVDDRPLKDNVTDLLAAYRSRTGLDNPAYIMVNPALKDKLPDTGVEVITKAIVVPTMLLVGPVSGGDDGLHS